MGKIITFGNLKGGVGKTTNSVMLAYMLGKKGYKTLVVDMDPQANATSLLLKTRQRIKEEIITFDKTLMTALSDDDIESIITSITDNLDILPSFADFANLPNFLEDNILSRKDRSVYFKDLLSGIKNDYDYIIIDTPPTLSLYTDNALLASDWIVIVMQTQERSLDGAIGYVNYLNQLIEEYDSDVAEFEILGILPVLLKNNSKVDDSVIQRARESFGANNLFNHVVKSMERLKRYDITGIGDPEKTSDSDYHDTVVFDLYEDIANELLERMKR